jgi:hypothetical protein
LGRVVAYFKLENPARCRKPRPVALLPSACENTRMLSRLTVRSLLPLFAAGLAFSVVPAGAAGTKTLSGKLRKVEAGLLTVEKPGLVSSSTVEIETDKATRVTGQLAPGMHVKIRYREQNGRRIALTVRTWPEHPSRQARRAAGQLAH